VANLLANFEVSSSNRFDIWRPRDLLFKFWGP